MSISAQHTTVSAPPVRHGHLLQAVRPGPRAHPFFRQMVALARTYSASFRTEGLSLQGAGAGGTEPEVCRETHMGKGGSRQQRQLAVRLPTRQQRGH